MPLSTAASSADLTSTFVAVGFTCVLLVIIVVRTIRGLRRGDLEEKKEKQPEGISFDFPEVHDYTTLLSGHLNAPGAGQVPAPSKKSLPARAASAFSAARASARENRTVTTPSRPHSSTLDRNAITRTVPTAERDRSLDFALPAAALITTALVSHHFHEHEAQAATTTAPPEAAHDRSNTTTR